MAAAGFVAASAFVAPRTGGGGGGGGGGGAGGAGGGAGGGGGGWDDFLRSVSWRN
ncbi:hypothetical protein ACX83Z_18785 [Xanthomonas euvesicatoria]